MFNCFLFRLLPDSLQDMSIVSTEMRNIDLPHKDVRPETIAHWIGQIESNLGQISISTLDDFKRSYPEIKNLSDSEQYLLYCYFHGRCFWKVTVQPSTAGGTVVALRVTPMRRHEEIEEDDDWDLDDVISTRSVAGSVVVDRVITLPEFEDNFPQRDYDNDDNDDDLEFVDFGAVTNNDSALYVAQAGEQVVDEAIFVVEIPAASQYTNRRQTNVRQAEVKTSRTSLKGDKSTRSVKEDKKMLGKADQFLKYNPNYTPKTRKRALEQTTSDEHDEHLDSLKRAMKDNAS